jgi:hypothetical protein
MRPARCSPSYVRKFHEMQERVLWPFFTKEMEAAQPLDVAALNGDLIDGRQPRNGGKQLWAPRRDDQCANAVAIAQTTGAGRYSLTLGTPYHNGEVENWEQSIAKELGASEAVAEHAYDVGGVAVNMAHHMGNTKSVPSRLTALSNEQARQLLWADAGQQPRADVIVRSHTHRTMFGGSWGDNWCALSTPALCGLGDDFGARTYRGLPVHFGFLVLVVKSRREWWIEHHILRLELLKARVTRL